MFQLNNGSSYKPFTSLEVFSSTQFQQLSFQTNRTIRWTLGNQDTLTSLVTNKLTKPQKKQSNSRTWNKNILQCLMRWLGRSQKQTSKTETRSTTWSPKPTEDTTERTLMHQNFEQLRIGAPLTQLRAGHWALLRIVKL